MKKVFHRKFDFHMREIIRGASVAFVMKAMGAGLGFGFNVVLARTLGADGAGTFFLALTVATIATVFGRLGLDNALVRFTAANAGVDNWTAVKGVYRKGMLLALTASGLSAAVVFAAAPFVSEFVFHKPTLTSSMRWMALVVAPLTLQALHSQMLKGLKRIFAFSLTSEHGVTISGLALIGLIMLGPAHGVVGAVWAYVIASILTLLLAFWMWRSATPQLSGVVGHFDTRELLHTSFPLFWVTSMNLALTWISSLMLGVWCTNADVGIFNVASRTAMLTSFILIAVNSIASPKFAELYQRGDLEQVGRMARNSAKLMILMSSPALLLLLLAPGWVMGLFGPKFGESGLVLSILALGQFINVATGSVVHLLMMTGHERVVRNNVAFAAIVNIVLNVILIPSIGVIGAAIATAVSLSTKNLVAAYLVWVRLGIQTIPLGWIGLGRQGRKTRPLS